MLARLLDDTDGMPDYIVRTTAGTLCMMNFYLLLGRALQQALPTYEGTEGYAEKVAKTTKAFECAWSMACMPANLDLEQEGSGLSACDPDRLTVTLDFCKFWFWVGAKEESDQQEVFNTLQKAFRDALAPFQVPI